MPSVQVKEVPAEIHLALRQKAAQAGQSLQEYLLAVLVRQAVEPDLTEVLATIEAHQGGRVPLSAAAMAVRAGRPRLGEPT